jgi:hypothetical protein
MRHPERQARVPVPHLLTKGEGSTLVSCLLIAES